MKKVHLIIRDLANVSQNLLNTAGEMKDLVKRGLSQTNHQAIIDLCSGSGGPMPDVLKLLQHDAIEARLIMTDLYPNQKYAD